MMRIPRPVTRQEVEQSRPARFSVDPYQPVGWLIEEEYSRNRRVEKTAVVFLANRECPLRCVMCDLWKQTLVGRTPAGAVVAQLEGVLPELRAATQIKLYNHGNFFDPLAVPMADRRAIAQRMEGFHTVIVENHPRFCGPGCAEFRSWLPEATQLEVAMGLEVANDLWLRWLHKQMTVADFCQAAQWLVRQGIFVRAFVLLGLPGTEAAESLHWALRSVREAFRAGADVVSIIPLRSGNGILDRLADEGWRWPSRLVLLETALFLALQEKQGRVFADLWQVENWEACPECRSRRLENLCYMNSTQQPSEPVACRCSTPITIP
ncbi:MAG: radical SAM protein [Pirellulaceae bacterium]|nr:MAG: radical SAM protein [Pirellulaceae bacterium]